MAKKIARRPAGKKYLDFHGRLVMVGFGSIGQGVLPLILRHIGIKPEQITIITDDMRGGEDEAQRYGVEFVEKRLTESNVRSVLDNRLGQGDFLLNLSVEVASTALIELCQKKGVLYLDTCIEPWPGGYTDPNLSVSRRSRGSRPCHRASATTAACTRSSRTGCRRSRRSGRPAPPVRRACRRGSCAGGT